MACPGPRVPRALGPSPDARLAQALASIQAIKGVEVGDGFETTRRRGSAAHDELFATADGIARGTDRAGGTEGGMSTGTVLRVRAGMKPIATVPHALRTIDIATGDQATAHHQRSDVCAVPAAGVVTEAMVAIELARAVLEKFGGDSIRETRRNLEGYLDGIPAELRTAPRPRRRSSRMTNEAEPLTLVLVGPMAAGKTSVGRRVARRLGSPSSTPTSASSPRTARSRRSSPRTARRTSGSSRRTAVREAIAEGGVISLGGGAVTDPETRALLRAHPVVFLTVSEAAVADRLRGGTRPLLAGEDPVEKWKRIFAERRGWYDEVASTTFDTSRRPMQRIADEIVAWRREQR